jgi:hypothetical protein
MSSSSPALFEGLIQNQMQDSRLPPLWQVIYNEGIRGNHILFQRQDVLFFESQPLQLAEFEDSLQTDAMQRIVVQLIACPDLSSMADIIDSLSQDIKQSVYTVYKRMISTWGSHLKLVLN